MTVQQFLTVTEMPMAEVAERVGAHLTRVYHWREGKSVPGGIHLAKLILLSERTKTPITVKAMAKLRRRTA